MDFLCNLHSWSDLDECADSARAKDRGSSCRYGWSSDHIWFLWPIMWQPLSKCPSYLSKPVVCYGTFIYLFWPAINAGFYKRSWSRDHSRVQKGCGCGAGCWAANIWSCDFGGSGWDFQSGSEVPFSDRKFYHCLLFWNHRFKRSPCSISSLSSSLEQIWALSSYLMLAQDLSIAFRKYFLSPAPLQNCLST